MILIKDNISWVWLGQLKYNQQFKTTNRFFFNNQYTGNLFRETFSGNKWKDENRLDLGWQKRISEKFSITTQLNSHVFSDDNAELEFNKNLLTQNFEYNIPTGKLL